MPAHHVQENASIAKVGQVLSHQLRQWPGPWWQAEPRGGIRLQDTAGQGIQGLASASAVSHQRLASCRFEKVNQQGLLV
jgi:hypothetical protein